MNFTTDVLRPHFPSACRGATRLSLTIAMAVGALPASITVY